MSMGLAKAPVAGKCETSSSPGLSIMILGLQAGWTVAARNTANRGEARLSSWAGVRGEESPGSTGHGGG